MAYVSVMQNYFSQMCLPLPETEKSNIVYENIRPEYYVPLCTHEITTFKRLKELCRILKYGLLRAQGFSEPLMKLLGTLMAPDVAYKGKPPNVHAVDPVKPKFCARYPVSAHTLAECRSTAIVCFRCGRKGIAFPSLPKLQIFCVFSAPRSRGP